MGNGNGGSLVFYDDTRAETAVVDHRVAAQMLVANIQFHLVGNESRGIVAVSSKVVYEMLAHKFFGSQGYIFAPEHVKNLHLAAVLAYLYVEFGKI